MPQSVQTSDGLFIVPGAYTAPNVRATAGGLGVTGVLSIVGEAASGPRFSLEDSLEDNSFGPDQLNDARAKYGSGPLLDALKGAISASADEQIRGSFQRAILVKTNAGVSASATILQAAASWASFAAKRAGADGNLISFQITDAASEVAPTTGPFLFCPPQVSTDAGFRVSGGPAATATVSAATVPSTTVTLLDAVSGVAATGGANRSVITAVAGTLTLTVDTGFQCHVVIAGASFNALPPVGDLVYIPTGSPFAVANEGSFVVTAASGSRIDLYKLLDAAGAGSVRTAPTTEGPLVIAATTDLRAFSPIVVTADALTVAQGYGRSLEVYNSGSGLLSNVAFQFLSATSSPPAQAASWVSASGSGKLLTSATERRVLLTDARQADGITESVAAGGEIVLTLGYTGATAAATVLDGVLTIVVTGGAGASPAPITLANYPTVSDLASYLSTLTGFTAAVASAAIGSLPATSLDEGAYTFATQFGVKTGRIKSDGYKFQLAVNGNSTLGAVVAASQISGLPDVQALTYLSAGSKGGSTDVDWAAAIDALRKVRCNFVGTCVSQDASLDAAQGLTDSTSTYTVNAVNANLKSHCLAMSQVKARKPRLAFSSFLGTFAAAKAAASDLSGARVTLAFQPVRTTSADGVLGTFQPWMGAMKAMGMQAAGFYKPVFNKLVDVSGVLPVSGFDPDEMGSQEDALTHGLLILHKNDDGGFSFLSDQTTYARDNNPIFNSFQAMYGVDVIVDTANRRMERAIVGQSTADVSATAALQVWESVLGDFLSVKLTAPSDGAEQGFRFAKVKKVGNTVFCEADVYEATALYFVSIKIGINVVQQSAG